MRAHFSIIALTCGAVTAATSCPLYPFLARNGSLPSLPPSAFTAAIASVNVTLHALLNANTLPGFSASVWYNGAEVQSWGGGVADKVTGRAPDPMVDVFRVASNTKLFTSMLAEVFAELGYIRSLDDPVELYAPSFVGPVDNAGDGAKISFRHLMSHTAGLPDSLPGNSDWSNVTTDAVFSAIARLPTIAPIGVMPLYSNLGISVLGHILAEFVAPASVRGDIGPLIKTYILEPLSLDADTGYAITPDVAARLCPAYDSSGARVPVEDLGWTAPCGTMWSTPRNLARFHQASGWAS